jgi:hypothetical protein
MKDQKIGDARNVCGLFLQGGWDLGSGSASLEIHDKNIRDVLVTPQRIIVDLNWLPKMEASFVNLIVSLESDPPSYCCWSHSFRVSRWFYWICEDEKSAR